MIRRSFARLLGALSVVLVVAGCAKPTPYDYSAFRESRPRSILVLPPLNSSPEVAASYGVLSRSTLPLAESGYYVLPVTLVDETFKQNGLAHPAEMHEAPPAKLREIFGADAALYMEVTEYGASYKIIQADIDVALKAKLVDLRSGALLWEGKARASTAEQQNQGGGLIGALISAVVNQIINSASEERTLMIATFANNRLLAASPQTNGILFGPYSPRYGTD